MSDPAGAGDPLPPPSSSTLHRAGSRRRSLLRRRDPHQHDGRPDGPPRRRRRWPRVLLTVCCALVVLAAAVLGGTYLWADDRLRQTAALPDDGRPPPAKGTNWLVIGTDTRSDLSRRERAELHVGGAGERNTDTVMLLHLGASGPYLVSLPRDSYVRVPGHGKNKINAAYALGGPRLLTRTVENATGIRVDHYAEVDFRGFTRIVESLDGVDVCLPQPLRDKKAGADLPAGCRTLDGTEALAYVRARHSDPQGDLGRVRRQQRLLSALVQEATGPRSLLNPFRLYPFLGSVLDAVTVDRDAGVLSLARMAWEVRGLTDGKGGTVTVPVADPGRAVPGIGEALIWDEEKARRLFGQVRRDVRITVARVARAAPGGPRRARAAPAPPPSRPGDPDAPAPRTAPAAR